MKFKSLCDLSLWISNTFLFLLYGQVHANACRYAVDKVQTWPKKKKKRRNLKGHDMAEAFRLTTFRGTQHAGGTYSRNDSRAAVTFSPFSASGERNTENVREKVRISPCQKKSPAKRESLASTQKKENWPAITFLLSVEWSGKWDRCPIRHSTVFSIFSFYLAHTTNNILVT
jgi:hypothetical protein